MKQIILALLLMLTTNAWATTSVLKQIDLIQNSAGGSQLSVPGSGSLFATDTNTVTFTNKSLSGSSNTFTNIPASAISSGQLGVANGGTGQASLTAHDVLVGNGTGGVTQVTPSTAGLVLMSNGTSSDPSFQAVTSAAPTINNSVASPQSVTAGGGVSLSTPSYSNVVFAKGGTASATVTVTATPSITACTAAGQVLRIVSGSSTDLFLLQNDADLSGSQVLINGPWTSGFNNGTPNTLTLMCDGAGTPHWVEMARQQ